MALSVLPVGRHATHFRQGLEDAAVQHLDALGLVEPFDVGVQGRLFRLDVLQGNACAQRPLSQGMGDELRVVVQANRQRHRALPPVR